MSLLSAQAMPRNCIVDTEEEDGLFYVQVFIFSCCFKIDTNRLNKKLLWRRIKFSSTFGIQKIIIVV